MLNRLIANSDENFELNASLLNNNGSVVLDQNDPLILDLAFISELSQEMIDADFFRKLVKTGAFATISTLVGVLRGLPSYDQKKDTGLLWFFTVGMVVLYGAETAWLLLGLEKEFISGPYPEQKIARTGKYFKIMKHFVSIALSIIPSAGYAPTSWNALGIETSLVVLFSNSLVFMRGYYAVFNEKNALMSYASKNTSECVQVTDGLSQIIDNAFPTLLVMSKTERKRALQEIYCSQSAGKIRVSVLMEQLKLLEKPNSSNECISWMRLNLGKPTTLIIALLLGLSDNFNYGSELLSVRLLSLPPNFFIDFLISHIIVNEFLDALDNKPAGDFASKYYSKTVFYSRLSFVGVLFGLFIGFSLSYPTGNDNYNHSVTQNFFTTGLFFFKNFILIYIISNVVLKSIITNYVEGFGSDEARDQIKLLQLLNYLKDDIIKKARPDIIMQLFSGPEGLALLSKLGIKRAEHGEKRNVFLKDTNSAKHSNGFFSKSYSNSQKATEENDLRSSLVRLVEHSDDESHLYPSSGGITRV